MAEKVIVWDQEARKSFRKNLENIMEDSFQAAQKVGDEILSLVDSLAEQPERFPPDRFKNGNDGSYRAFEKHSLRLSYHVSEKQIRILRVRHVKQRPLKY